jgi:hypothetical protein
MHLIERSLIGLLLPLVAGPGAAAAGGSPLEAGATEAPGAAGSPVTDGKVEHAEVVARARAALRDAGVDAANFPVELLEPTTWPDTSLGCGRRGEQYLQVVTSGYRVRLRGPVRVHEVHVAGSYAVVCPPMRELHLKTRPPRAPLRNVDAMVERARGMLFGALHAAQPSLAPEAIRPVALVPMVWPDSSLGCATEAAPVPGSVAGYRIVLAAQGREYTFHTDRQRVLACPPIEAQ